MNFYAFNIGDYAGATRHLSWDEDMAYRRMLDAYYSREAPLPLEPRQVYRLVGASEDRQRQAVDVVLAEFFERREDGWHNSRADEEISKAVEKSATRSEKAENERERQRRHRARRKELFDRLREKGIVPHFDTPTAELEAMASSHAPVTVTERDRSRAENVSAPATRYVTRDSSSEQRDTNNATRDETRDRPNVTQDITANNPNPNPNKEDEDDTRARKKRNFERLDAALRGVAELKTHPVITAPVLAPILKLVEDEHLDIATQVIPSIRRQAAAATKPIKGWSYFVAGIRQDAETPVLGAPNGSQHGRRASNSEKLNAAFDRVAAHISRDD